MSDSVASTGTGPVREIAEEAARILDAAHQENIPLRLLGGLAIHFQCPSMKTHSLLQRTYKDLDFVTLGKAGGKTKALFLKLGYEGSTTFNALHGHQRLLFWDTKHERQVDIFVDRMQMCHNIDFRTRLHIDARTLSPADLLLTKLQVVELNEKDITDAIALFHDKEVTNSDDGIHADYIARLTSNDWGLHKTLATNLRKTKEYAAQSDFPLHVQHRVDILLDTMEKQPKSLAWKARAMVGERVRWYELPEEPR